MAGLGLELGLGLGPSFRVRPLGLVGLELGLGFRVGVSIHVGVLQSPCVVFVCRSTMARSVKKTVKKTKKKDSHERKKYNQWDTGRLKSALKEFELLLRQLVTRLTLKSL